MEPNEGNEGFAAPGMEDIETVEMSVATPRPDLTQPDTPVDAVDNAEAIADAETTILQTVGAADTSDISGEVTIQFAAQKPGVASLGFHMYPGP